MTNNEKKYRTAADALYGLRDSVSKQKEYWGSHPSYADAVAKHKETCERCTATKMCEQGVAVAKTAFGDITCSWMCLQFLNEIDEALQNVFGTCQKGHRLHDPWDGETWTFSSPSGKGLTVMRDGQDNLEFPDIDVLDIADQLLYEMLFATDIGYTWKTEYETPDGQSVVIAEGVGGHLKTYHQLAVALACVAKQGGAA